MLLSLQLEHSLSPNEVKSNLELASLGKKTSSLATKTKEEEDNAVLTELYNFRLELPED